MITLSVTGLMKAFAGSTAAACVTSMVTFWVVPSAVTVTIAFTGGVKALFSAAVTVKWEVSLLTVHQFLLDVTLQLLAFVATVISLLPPSAAKWMGEADTSRVVVLLPPPLPFSPLTGISSLPQPSNKSKIRVVMKSVKVGVCIIFSGCLCFIHSTAGDLPFVIR